MHVSFITGLTCHSFHKQKKAVTGKLVSTFISSLLFFAIVLLANAAAAQSKIKTKVQQPALGYRTVNLLTVNGLQFKDLNKNGKLDRYEDWRLSNEERAKDLLSKMSLEEKVGFMLISTTRLKNDWDFEAPKDHDPITSDFNEDDLVSTINMFTRKPLPVPIMTAAGTTKAVTKFHERHFILRANVSARSTAEWSNKLQALCEKDGLGIPAIVTSNPRNHITRDAAIGLSVGKTVFSTWPGELGLSAIPIFKEREPVLIMCIPLRMINTTFNLYRRPGKRMLWCCGSHRGPNPCSSRTVRRSTFPYRRTP